MATEQTTKTEAPKASKTSATLEPIECTVKKKFLGDDGRIWEEGKTYYYEPVEDRPFPYPLLEPKDKDKAEEARKAWREYKREKDSDLRARGDTRALLDKISAQGA